MVEGDMDFGSNCLILLLRIRGNFIMDEVKVHEMRIEKIHSSDIEEWLCPICGRRLLVRWTPEFQKIVLESGDEYAYHSGSKGGVQIQPPNTVVQENETESPEEDSWLKPWEEWMQRVNFSNLWHAGD